MNSPHLPAAIVAAGHALVQEVSRLAAHPDSTLAEQEAAVPACVRQAQPALLLGVLHTTLRTLGTLPVRCPPCQHRASRRWGWCWAVPRPSARPPACCRGRPGSRPAARACGVTPRRQGRPWRTRRMRPWRRTRPARNRPSWTRHRACSWPRRMGHRGQPLRHRGRDGGLLSRRRAPAHGRRAPIWRGACGGNGVGGRPVRRVVAGGRGRHSTPGGGATGACGGAPNP